MRYGRGRRRKAGRGEPARVNRIKAFFRRLDWWWDTRDCPHPPHRRRRIGGDERMAYGYLSRCLDCGKPLKR